MTVANSFPTRQQAAEQIVAAGGITIDGDAIKVPSSDGRRFYRVRRIGDRVICSCADFANRQLPCKHIRAAELFAAQQSEKSE